MTPSWMARENLQESSGPLVAQEGGGAMPTLVCAQQVGQLQDVGSPILLPLERAELLGRRADPISD
jgi:hypothetical protein